MRWVSSPGRWTTVCYDDGGGGGGTDMGPRDRPGEGLGRGGGGGGDSPSDKRPGRAKAEASAFMQKLPSCFVGHYGLGDAAIRGASWFGALPIEKAARGLPVIMGASKYTNLISYTGFKLAPGLKIGTRILGTTRLAGIVGRANVLLAAGLAAYDATSIALCAVGLQDYQ